MPSDRAIESGRKGELDILAELRAAGLQRATYNLDSPYGHRPCCRSIWKRAAIEEAAGLRRPSHVR